MRNDICFKVDGLTCRGWFFRPAGPGRRPVVVYCNGMGAVNGGSGARFAELFAARGYCALTFDYRYSGASDGTPKGRVIPSLQHDDIRVAIGCALEQDGVDPDKLILEGASYGGAHALFIGALDPRVKAVITLVSGLGAHHLVADQKTWNAVCRQMSDAMMNHKDELFPMVAPQGQPCMLPYPDCYEWLMKNTAKDPLWINGITNESRLRSLEYVPTVFIDAISPRPLLMFAAEHDSLIPVARQRKAFDLAQDPKRFEVLPCGHFQIYDPGPARDRAMDITVEWLTRHGLGP